MQERNLSATELTEKPKHVFLITIDCLRADALSCIAEGRLTPNIDRLAEDSVLFTRAFANGPGTNQSFPAILTSTYFLMHGGMRLLPQYTTLAEVLNSHGFKTVAFHSNPFLSKGLGWSRGFSEFYDFMETLEGPSAFVTRRKSKGSSRRLMTFVTAGLGANLSTTVQRLLKRIYYKLSRVKIPYLDGKELKRHAIEWVEKNTNDKFLLWMHYMDPHYPYVPPDEYMSDFSSREEAFNFNLSINYEKPSKDTVEVLRKLYAGEVRYVDACIGEFLKFLDEKALLDDSLILLMADHGHAFMEHGRFGHAYDILYNEVLGVPLIMHGLNTSESVDFPVQLLDVPPTILEVLGIEKPRDFIGDSLLSIPKGIKNCRNIFSESAKPDLINLRYDISKKVISCLKDEWKLIINELWETTELYNIKRDLQEKNNLAEKETRIRKELELLAKKHLSRERIYRLKKRNLEEKNKETRRLNRCRLGAKV
jgi:arylsulfatase A-like enzyme